MKHHRSHRPLELQRETLRTLTVEHDLRRVVGGASTDGCGPSALDTVCCPPAPPKKTQP